MFKVKLALVKVDPFMGSTNVAAISEFTAQPVAVSVGLVDKTVGGVVSGVAPVVNAHE